MLVFFWPAASLSSDIQTAEAFWHSGFTASRLISGSQGAPSQQRWPARCGNLHIFPFAHRTLHISILTNSCCFWVIPNHSRARKLPLVHAPPSLAAELCCSLGHHAAHCCVACFTRSEVHPQPGDMEDASDVGVLGPQSLLGQRLHRTMLVLAETQPCQDDRCRP